MAHRKKLETVLGKRLRGLMSMKKLTVETLALEARLAERSIRNLLTGSTERPRDSTIRKLAEALDVDADWLAGRGNSHLAPDVEGISLELYQQYGPSIVSALRVGPLQTTWLNYDLARGDRYPFDGVTAFISNDIFEPPADFKRIRSILVEQNEELKKKSKEPNADISELGKPWFDGPTLFLQRYDIEHTDDGREEKSVRVRFGRSTYANNFTAKSTSASFLRRRALSQFQFLNQPIPWLASGVGVVAVVFCRGGNSFVACRRSDSESFRSREFDASIVEGLHPNKDADPLSPSSLNVYNAMRRAIFAELGVRVSREDCYIIGLGIDLEYYQWNFIGYAYSDLTYEEIHQKWQAADEKWEACELREVDASAVGIANFIHDNPVWSSGIAAIYFSHLKRADDDEAFDLAFAAEIERLARA